MHAERLVTSRRSLLLGAGALSLAGLGGAAWARTAAFPRTQAILDRYIAEEKIPGAAVGVRTPAGDCVFLQAGRLDYGDAPPVDRDSLFRIYSMTKPVTGTAAALLMEDGRLTIDTPVADIIPEFANLTVAIDPEKSLEARPAQQVMTIRHLLTHTSGLTYTIAGKNFVQNEYRRRGGLPFTGALEPGDGPRAHDLDAMVAALGQIPLLNEPGAAYNYSVGLDVLGLVIQRVSGMPFPEFLQRRLFNPIGMTNTVWQLPAGRALAQVYDYSNGGRTPAAGASAELYSQPVTLFAGGAGLISSAKDYLAFLTTLLNDGRAGSVVVMKPETARLVRTDILPPPLDFYGNGYGFGGYVGRPNGQDPGSFGWDGAAGTKAWMDPERGFAAVAMVQFFPWGSVDMEAVRTAIVEDVAAL